MIIAAPQYTIFVPFSGRLYVNAKPIQADDGSDRGHVQGLSSGGLRCWYGLETAGAQGPRVERARPVSDEFGRLGPDKGPSIVWGGGRQRRLARRRQEPSRVFRSARHTPPRISHSCTRARTCHRCSDKNVALQRVQCSVRKGGSGSTGGIEKRGHQEDQAAQPGQAKEQRSAAASGDGR